MHNEKEYIDYLAHMLDESSSSYSYYKAFMDQHREDKQPVIFENLVKEFSDDLSRHSFDLSQCIDENGCSNESSVSKMLDKMDFHYNWGQIKAQTYFSILKWSSSMMNGVYGKYIGEEDDTQIRRNISRKTLEECLDTICHNVNVLEANSSIYIYGADDNWELIEDLFKKYNLPKSDHVTSTGYKVKDSFFMVCEAYSYWANYYQYPSMYPPAARYVCNSDEAPSELREVLNECSYDADDIDIITTINRCLDITHHRGDLALAFVEGGSATCQKASSM